MNLLKLELNDSWSPVSRTVYLISTANSSSWCTFNFNFIFIPSTLYLYFIVIVWIQHVLRPCRINGLIWSDKTTFLPSAERRPDSKNSSPAGVYLDHAVKRSAASAAHDTVTDRQMTLSTVSDSTPDTSLWDCVTTASSFGCQPSTDSSACTSTGHIRRSGVRCRRSVDMELNSRSVHANLPAVLLFLAVFSEHFSSQSTNVYSTLEAWRGCAV